MALQSKVGTEKFVYKADAGDVTLNGEDMAEDFDFVIEKITGNTSRGTLKRTGNKMVDFTFEYFDVSVRSGIEADEGNLNNLEIFQLGSSTVDETIPNVEMIVEDRFDADPESDTPGGLQIRVRRVWNG